MKIVHFSNWGLRRSGLYECTKDQIKYERKYGIDSQLALFEHDKPNKDWIDDNWLKPIPWEECKDADLYVIHRGLPAELDKKEKPVITVIHGTVEFLMLEELFSNAEKTPFNTHINLIRDCAACVAVNPHDFDIYKLYDIDNKLELIHDAIDIERYTIEGYQHPFNNRPQILFCDSLRVNKYPAHIIWAMSEIVKEIPTAKLTIVGLDLLNILTWRNLILRSPNKSLAENLELVQLMTTEVRPYMRGADILVNGNMSGIPSRTELEAMACGCQVVSYADYFTKYKCSPFDIKDMAKQIIRCWNDIKDNRKKARLEARQWVFENANMEKQVVNKFIPLYKKVLGV
jgi:glycosyltransferase involved in cell wall biosynthesis